MKQAIMGYITALINVHNNALGRIPDRVATSNIKPFTSELNDLLDYVADIPEDDKAMPVLTSTQVEILRKRIIDLEKICKANSEVMNKQCKKIRELQDGNHRWCVLCKQLREKNKILEVENTCFKITDTNDFKVYDEENLEFYIDEIYYDKEDDKFYFRCKEEEIDGIERC